jgi:hypothetical protein
MTWATTYTAFDDVENYGFTIAQLEAIIADRVKLDTSDSDELSRIDEAITVAGQAACAWEGRDWWFLHATSNFDTVDGTASYALRTVNSSVMTDLWAIERVYIETDWPLKFIEWDQYRNNVALNSTEGKPMEYTVHGEGLTMYPWEIPDDAYTIYVDYIKRHSRIINATSADNTLLIPDIFHYSVYVDGAVWVLRNGVGDPLGLRNSPGFVDTMRRLAESDPKGYNESSDENNHAGVVTGWFPHNKPVFQMGDNVMIFNNP